MGVTRYVLAGAAATVIATGNGAAFEKDPNRYDPDLAIGNIDSAEAAIADNGYIEYTESDGRVLSGPKDLTKVTYSAPKNTIPEFKSVVGTDGDTYPAPWVASCVAEAAGTDSVDELGALNPSAFVGSGYIGKSLTRFQVRVIANDISDKCDNVVTKRDFAVEQIYAGKSNIKGGPVHLTSLEDYDTTRRVALKAAFTCIRGKQSRGYKINATDQVGLADGTNYTFTGAKTIRGKSDGC